MRRPRPERQSPRPARPQAPAPAEPACPRGPGQARPRCPQPARWPAGAPRPRHRAPRPDHPPAPCRSAATGMPGVSAPRPAADESAPHPACTALRNLRVPSARRPTGPGRRPPEYRRGASRGLRRRTGRHVPPGQVRGQGYRPASTSRSRAGRGAGPVDQTREPRRRSQRPRRGAPAGFLGGIFASPADDATDAMVLEEAVPLKHGSPPATQNLSPASADTRRSTGLPVNPPRPGENTLTTNHQYAGRAAGSAVPTRHPCRSRSTHPRARRCPG